MPFKTPMKRKAIGPLTASLISGSLFGGLAAISVRWYDADPKSAIIVAIFCSIILSCMIIAEDENRDRLDE